MPRGGVADASLLFTLGDAGALHVLWEDREHTWHITPLIRNEIRSEPTRSEISNAVLSGQLTVAELSPETAGELVAFARWRNVVDAGEAEAIAIAVSRGWVVGVEDRFAQRKLTAEVGRDAWVNSANLLIGAVERGALTLPVIDGIFRTLDCYGGYVKRGVSSLSDLMLRKRPPEP